MYHGSGIEVKFDKEKPCCIFKFCEFAKLVKGELKCNNPNPDIVCGEDSFQCFGHKRIKKNEK